ncbi:hypothetical protein CVT26_001827 [Gymnopilus dilepis]|uniref:Peptidase S8/S53 domain-containing protein n=1 Tax=Gymnopilus dilepis TaxID=231916 RepID=A0A409VRZ3_9AGAR|nr:hypothetical protein CVT26_001827 [Gymnopilus dilepis]
MSFLFPVHEKLELASGEKVPNRYIIEFKEGLTEDARWNALPGLEMDKRDRYKFFQTAEYEGLRLHACVGTLQHHGELRTILDSPTVKRVYEDAIIKTQEIKIQKDAPWGISRLSSADKLVGSNAMRSSFNYVHEIAQTDSNDEPADEVVVYIVDTGIDPNHEDILSSSLGYFVPKYADGTNVISRRHASSSNLESGLEPQHLKADTHGHGTHVAGIIGGKRFGVAKGCKMVSVAVMNPSGTCPISDLIGGLMDILYSRLVLWLSSPKGAKFGQSEPTFNNVVVNLSLGSPRSGIVDKVVNILVEAGIHVVAAACNQSNDARYYSPAGMKSVITVGASTFTDSRAWFSNIGSMVDIYAPGVFIHSSTYNPNHRNDTEMKSGTSQACAHVSGLVAYLLRKKGLMSPKEMKQLIIDLSLKDRLSDIPLGSNNRLANFSRLLPVDA